MEALTCKSLKLYIIYVASYHCHHFRFAYFSLSALAASSKASAWFLIMAVLSTTSSSLCFLSDNAYTW